MNWHQFEFVVTPDDFAEAFAGARRLRWKLPLNRKALFGIVFSVIVAVELWKVLHDSSKAVTHTPTTLPYSSLNEIWLPFLPWLLIFFIV